jgi:hypothetical protein
MSKAQEHEAEAVRTTIVGGRPPGSGRNNVPVPRGIEVLIKKASVDAEFRELLLTHRGKAAATIQLELDPAEDAMLSAIPQAQLARIVDQTTVPAELRYAFLGRVAPVMLAALGVGLVSGCFRERPAVEFGVRPPPATNAPPTQAPPTNPPTTNAPPPLQVYGLRAIPADSLIQPPSTSPPTTNVPPVAGVQPDPPFIVIGLMATPPTTNAPTTNSPASTGPSTDAPSTNAPPPAVTRGMPTIAGSLGGMGGGLPRNPAPPAAPQLPKTGTAQ